MAKNALFFVTKSNKCQVLKSDALAVGDFFLRPPFIFSATNCSFICQDTTTRRQQREIFGFNSKLSHVNHWPQAYWGNSVTYFSPKKQQANLLVYLNTSCVDTGGGVWRGVKKCDVIFSYIYTNTTKLVLYLSDLVRLVNHLFVKVPRPGDSEGTISVFESSCHLLLPV